MIDAAEGKRMPKVLMHMEQVPLEDLLEHPDNDYPLDDIDDLADSIRREGLAQLPLVRPYNGRYQMIAGHRRLAAFRRLAEQDPSFSVMPVNVMEDMDDERALVLLDATNLMTRQMTPLERAAKFRRIKELVPNLREKSPELRGVRTNKVIADLITEQTGQPISEATVKRALAAAKRAEESRAAAGELADQLIPGWQEEVHAGVFPVELVRQIAARDSSVQRDLYVEYQRDGLSVKQLAKRLEVRRAKGDVDGERVLDRMIRDARDLQAMKKVDGVDVDRYRLDYLRRLLAKL